MAWNYIEFEVRYESLADELKIGDHYVRLLLEQGVCSSPLARPEAPARLCRRRTPFSNGRLAMGGCTGAGVAGVTTTTVRNPHEFIYDLYHRFLLATNTNMRSMSLQAMAIVYGAYAHKIGQFNDMRFMVKMLASAQTRLERDRYLLFIDKVRRHGILAAWRSSKT